MYIDHDAEEQYALRALDSAGPTAVSYLQLETNEIKPHSVDNRPKVDLDRGGDEPSAWIHSGWRPTRVRVYDALYDVLGECRRLVKFRGCGSNAYVYEATDQPGLFKICSDYCKSRWCQPCGTYRGQTIARNLLAASTGLEVRFLTLTSLVKETDLEARHDPNRLKARLDHVYKSFGRLRRCRSWRRRISGGAAFCELKWKPDSNGWNVHLHMLVTGKYYPKRVLSADWYAATGDSFIVDIRRPSGPKDVVRYVTKYVAKPLHPSVIHCHDALCQAITDLHHRRTCLTFGTWRGVDLTAVSDEHTWICVGSLKEIAENARSGDPVAVQILDSLRLLDTINTSPPRGPPPNLSPSVDAPATMLFGLWRD